MNLAFQHFAPRTLNEFLEHEAQPGASVLAATQCFCFSSSSARQDSKQVTGGTQSGSSGQALGDQSSVNTGTQTTVQNDTTVTTESNSRNQFGNNNVVTYNGLTDAGLASIGNAISSLTSGNGGGGASGAGGVTIANTPPAGTTSILQWSTTTKWAVGAAAAVALLFIMRLMFRKASK